MNKKIIPLFLIFIFSLPLKIQAQDVAPVVGGNGFSCTKTQAMVSCKGKFPGVLGSFSATALYQVSLAYETPGFPGNRYIFDSTTGCLMRIDFDNSGKSKSSNVWNSAGIQKTFLMPFQQNEALQYCQGK